MKQRDWRLIAAVSNEDPATAEDLLRQGANSNAVDGNGVPVLIHSVVRNMHGCMFLLLRFGADPRAAAASRFRFGHRDFPSGTNAVQAARIVGCETFTAVLSRWSPLHVAVSSGRADAVAKLLARGMEPNVVDASGMSPLFCASANGHVAAARALLRNGAGASSLRLGKGGYTPLLMACKNGHTDVVSALLDEGAAIDETLGAEFRADASTAAYIHDVPVRMFGTPGATALWTASCSGHEAVVRKLLQRGATVDKADVNGETPLWCSSWAGHPHIVRLLLSHGAAVDARNAGAKTPLWIASAKGHLEVVRLLLDGGAAVNAANSNGVTPLWIACQEGQEGVARELLRRGAAVDAPSSRGLTPLAAAIKCSRSSRLMSALIEHGARAPMFVARSPACAAHFIGSGSRVEVSGVDLGRRWLQRGGDAD